MKSFSRWVVTHPQGIIVTCVLLLIPCFYAMAHTRINYDLLTYLPNSLNSVQGENILEKDFRVAGNAFLMVDNASPWQVRDIKQRISAVQGVEKVIWIDNWADITVPEDFIPAKVKDNFYSGDSTLLQIQFKEGSASEETVQAIKDIKAIMDRNMYLGGSSAILADLRQLVDHERVLYLIVAVLLIILILSLTMSSTLVPVLFLGSIGAAIVYNLGTNLVFGQISYVTSAIAAVLQLGVTMDFSIFLMHRYMEEKKRREDKEEAMAEAISKTFLAIGASSLTAMAGFLSLIVMQIGIGRDMGLVMAKGVALGVIVSLTLLPALILVCDGVISRFQHRTFLPGFEWTAGLVSRRRWALVVLFVLLLFPAYYGKDHVKVFYSLSDALPRDIASVQSTEAIKSRFGSSDTLYLITPVSERWKLAQLSRDLGKIPGVKSVTAPTDYADAAIPDEFIPASVKSNYSNGRYDYTIIQSKYRPAEKSSAELIKQMRSLCSVHLGEYYLSGESVLTDDLIKLAGEDQRKVDIWSIGAIAAILAIAFGSVSLPVILVMVIELAILINLGIPFYSGKSIPFVAMMTIGAIQLGSCVNYAILMVSRFREELASSDKVTAARNAVMGTAPSIVTSALTLCFATVGVGMISKINMIGSLTNMIARGAFISMFAILFFLPAILVVSEGLIGKTTLRWATKGGKEDSCEAGVL